jgi:hypothetical protein
VAELVAGQEERPVLRVTHPDAADFPREVCCRQVDMGPETGPPRLEWWFAWPSLVLIASADQPDRAAATIAQVLAWEVRRG